MDGVCAEDGDQDHMVLVLNAGDNAGSYGFADAHEDDEYPALVLVPRRGCYDMNDVGASVTWGLEFRYDAPRQRYLMRRLDPEYPSTYLDEMWTDYLGDNPITDLRTAAEYPYDWEDTRHYEFGVDEDDLDTGETQYLRDDLLGTAVARTDVPTSGYAQTIERKIYTAFGELIYYGGSAIDGCTLSAHDRYGYAGQWGYQEHDISSNGQINPHGFGDGIADNWILASPVDGFPFQHTGARYYDPSTGRFLQRDPIGIRGGMNVYQYVEADPVRFTDPEGLCGSSLCSRGAAAILAELAAEGYNMGRIAATNPTVQRAVGAVGFALSCVLVEQALRPDQPPINLGVDNPIRSKKSSIVARP